MLSVPTTAVFSFNAPTPFEIAPDVSSADGKRFPWNMLVVNPGMDAIEDADELLGDRVHLEAESKCCREVISIQVHPDIPLPEEMIRMCPVFGQPKSKVIRTQDDADFDFDLPFDYGSIATIGAYRSAAVWEDKIGGRFYGPDYRLYVAFPPTVPDDSEYGESLDPMEPANAFTDNDDADDDADDNPAFARVKVKESATDTFNHGSRLVFEFPESGTLFFADVIDMARNEDNRGQIATLSFESDTDEESETKAREFCTEFKEAMATHKSPLNVWQVKDTYMKDDEIERLIHREQTKVETLPATLMGLVSRHEDVYLHDIRKSATLACIMMGEASLLVQPDFYEDDWKPGDRIYMLLRSAAADDDDDDDDQQVPPEPQSKEFDIYYVHREEIDTTDDSEEYFVFLGVYLGPSHHPYFKCCRVSLSPCVSERIYKNS